MIKHVLKDGTVLEDITGYVVRESDCPAAYAILDRVLQREARDVSIPAKREI